MSKIGTTIFVDPGSKCRKYTFNNIRDALKMAENYSGPVVIKISPGIYKEGFLEIPNGVTLKGSGKLATQIWATLDLSKLTDISCLERLSLYSKGFPIILGIGTGTLFMESIFFNIWSTPLGYISSGTVRIKEFDSRVYDLKNNLWIHTGGTLELNQGSQAIKSSSGDLSIYSIANFLPKLVLNKNIKIHDGLSWFRILSESKSGRVKLLTKKFLCWIENLSNKPFRLEINNKEVNISDTCKLIGDGNCVSIESVNYPTQNIELRTGKVSTYIESGSGDTTGILVGDITTQKITGSMTLPNSPGTYNYTIVSGSGTITFPGVDGLVANIGNNGFQYTAVTVPGYSFLDPDSGEQVPSLDLSSKLIWQIENSSKNTDTWLTTYIPAGSVTVNMVGDTYRSQSTGKNSLVIVSRNNARIGIGGLTMENSENLLQPIQNIGDAKVVISGLTNI